MIGKKETQYKIPKKASDYPGEFIVFFSEDEEPEILFHSLIAEESYRRAEEIKRETKRTPIVFRVAEDKDQLLRFLLLEKQ